MLPAGLSLRPAFSVICQQQGHHFKQFCMRRLLSLLRVCGCLLQSRRARPCSKTTTLKSSNHRLSGCLDNFAWGCRTALFSNLLSYVYQPQQAPSGLVTTRKTLPGTSFSDLQRLFDLNMKTHLGSTRRKRLTYHPERIPDDSICGSPPSPQVNRLLFTGLHSCRK